MYLNRPLTTRLIALRDMWLLRRLAGLETRRIKYLWRHAQAMSLEYCVQDGVLWYMSVCSGYEVVSERVAKVYFWEDLAADRSKCLINSRRRLHWAPVRLLRPGDAVVQTCLTGTRWPGVSASQSAKTFQLVGPWIPAESSKAKERWLDTNRDMRRSE